MARPGTVQRVHSATLDLVARHDPTALTMEGIAAAAGVGKQTLYRSWPSVAAILFDALLASPGPSVEPPTGVTDPTATLEWALASASDEISREPRASLLRRVAAAIQTDDLLAAEYRERLLAPQLAQFHPLVEEAGAARVDAATELLLAPIFYRWFLRLPPFAPFELHEHVATVLAATDR